MRAVLEGRPAPQSGLNLLQRQAAVKRGDGPLGSFTNVKGERRSRRLNPDSVAIGLVLASKPPSEAYFTELMNQADKYLPEEEEAGPVGGKKRRYHGGDDDLVLLDGVLEVLGEDRVAFYKAVVLYVASNTGKIARDVAKAAIGPTLEYLQSRLAGLGNTSLRVVSIAFRLADNIVQTPLAAANLSLAGFGFTVNFVSYVLKNVNELGAAGAEYLLREDTAKQAADAATDSIKTATTTAIVGAVVLNQIGVLPLSAILAAILVTVQANLGTGGGRAYLVAGFYAWYKTQTVSEKAAIKKAAKDYATAAANAAKASATAAAAAATAAAPQLEAAAKAAAEAAATAAKAAAGQAATAVKGAAAALATQLKLPGKAAKPGEPSAVGKNAVQAIVTGEGAPAGQAGIADAEIATALQGEEAVKAAALAVSVAEETAPPAEVVRARRGAPRARAPVVEGEEKEGGRRTTRKRTSKRRVTRRRKATKVLTTPTFVY
jgi:hypothetical protein